MPSIDVLCLEVGKRELALVKRELDLAWPKKYQLKLWGRSGSVAITARLKSIYRTHADIKATLTPFLKDAGILTSSDLKKRPDAEASSFVTKRASCLDKRFRKNRRN
jgi:hypothetical protein